MKLVSVVGVPKPLEAIFCMAEVEREEDKDYSFSRYVISNHYLLCLFRFQEGSEMLFESPDPPFAFGKDLGVSSVAHVLTLDSSEHWNSGPENRQRGRDWLATIYRHNDNRTAEMMAAHKDFRWLSIEITYGLYLSDHSILDGIDTELVVLSGIMLQNLKRETGWHLRGMRRIGVAKEDVVKVWELVSTPVDSVVGFVTRR